MKIAFLTEMEFVGRIPSNHPNMRTEFAWMHALGATHHNIHNPHNVVDYDAVVVIFPKGKLYLSAEGTRLSNASNPVSGLLSSGLVDKLKANNKRVYYMQEGPHWWYNDYELADQINFYNMVASCDGILCHNTHDFHYYTGLFPDKHVAVMPTLMIEDPIKGLNWQPQDKVIIGGNFARWYGGFESHIIAQEFELPIWGQTSHAMRDNEDELFPHLPRAFWTDWMKQLSEFKYAVHLMPTVAAGTFSLNCAYFGIPCIGNINVDTQKLCHPDLSVDVHDLKLARALANNLVHDAGFYEKCSVSAKENYKQHYNQELFLTKVMPILAI